MENQSTAATLRQVFDQKNAIYRTAQMIFEQEIGLIGDDPKLRVTHVMLDDDQDFPTIIIMGKTCVGGNESGHTIILPLEEFAVAYEGAWV